MRTCAKYYGLEIARLNQARIFWSKTEKQNRNANNKCRQ